MSKINLVIIWQLNDVTMKFILGHVVEITVLSAPVIPGLGPLMHYVLLWWVYEPNKSMG